MAGPDGELWSIDDDTCRAVIQHWQTDREHLPALFLHPPRTGRLSSPEPMPYVHVDGAYARHDSGFGYRKDVRKVTITLRGTREQTVRGLALVLRLFNRGMGGPDLPGLVYPSGARFIKWWPTKDELKQEETTKDGLDVWAGVVEAEVTSVRAP